MGVVLIMIETSTRLGTSCLSGADVRLPSGESPAFRQGEDVNAAEAQDMRRARTAARAVLDRIDDGAPVPRRERDRLTGALDRLDRHETRREGARG